MSQPKEVRKYNGKSYVLEDSIVGDISIIKAWKADKYGNCIFRGTARNFNPDVAVAGRHTIAEVEEIVEIGELQPHEIQLPGVYVHAIVKANVEKRIEKLTVEKSTTNSSKPVDPKKAAAQAIRDKIAKRASLELQDGMSVNLGIGM